MEKLIPFLPFYDMQNMVIIQNRNHSLCVCDEKAQNVYRENREKQRRKSIPGHLYAKHAKRQTKHYEQQTTTTIKA